MTQTELKKIFLSSVLPVYLEEEGDKVVLYQGDKELTKLKTGEEIDSYLLEVYRTLISYDWEKNKDLLKNSSYDDLELGSRLMKAFWEEIERNEATEKVEKLLWETGGINKQFANYNKYMTCLYCQKSITPEEFANLPNWHTISHLTCYQKKGERSNCLAPRKVVKETNHG